MKRIAMGCLGLVLAFACAASADDADRREIEELKALLRQQQDSIRQLNKRIDQLEGRTPVPAKGKAAATAPAAKPAPVAAAPETKPEGPTSPAEIAETKMFGKRSPVADRRNLDDRQEAAARPGDYVMDPSYRGYIPIPWTVFMLKFNPKPRLDMMYTTRNPGDAKFRFVPANLPLNNTAAFGGGEQFDATANGSQIRVDMRAPTMPGSFRLYYQNDFFGAETSQMRYRLQHFFGQYYGIVAGFTYGIFEDPDAWPDTVDYEGPNAIIFARRPLVHYLYEIDDDWSINFGLEEPNIAVDTTGDNNATSQQKAPDGGFNVRWTPGDLGHVQFSTIFRDLGVRATRFNDSDTFGWGLGLSGSLNLTENDAAQFWGVYGNGIGGLGNDSGFQNTDAAFNGNGDIVALEYMHALGAITHKWTPRWRSTATFGWVKVGNTSMQAGDAYHLSRYGSLNLVYQLFTRLSIGVEGLYGFREVKGGADTDDVYRVQLGMVYSPFD